MRALVLLLCLWASPVAAQCVTVQPAADWVCVNGGWLPPGYPPVTPAPTPILPSVQPPTGTVPFWPPTDTDPNDPNGWIMAYAKRGMALPPGDVWFTPPLRLRDTAKLLGVAGRTVLRPTTATAGVLVLIESSLPGNLETGYPIRQVVQDLALVCASPAQVGMEIVGANLTLERVSVSGCGEGIRFTWAVNISISQSQVMWNLTGLYLVGSGPNTVTTIRVRDSIVAGSRNAGVLVRYGLGVTFDTCIIEGNQGTGVQIVEAQPRGVDVMLRDVWFEANGVHISDPARRVQADGTTIGR